MSLDRAALELIQDTALNAAVPQPVAGVSRPTLTAGPNHKLLDIEHLYPGRSRFRGHLTTNSLADFIAYTKGRWAQWNSASSAPAKDDGQGVPPWVPVFIDADAMKAKAHFNLGTVAAPGHGDDAATLTLKPTAVFAAINAIKGKRLDQKALAEFLEDWRTVVRPFDGDFGELTLAKAVTAIRKVKITELRDTDHSEGALKVAKTSLEQVEASSIETIPGYLGFDIEPYAGLQPVALRLRLSVITSDDKPTFTLRIVREEEELEKIAQDFKRVLFDDLKDAATLTVGTFAL